MARVNVATREAVGQLEHRFGRKRLYFAGGAVLLVLLVLLLRGLSSSPKTPNAPAPRPVATATVTSKDVPRYLDEIGTTAAFETVQVQAQVGGQIIARSFKDGADVKRGDSLFTIDPRPYQAALEQAEGALAQAQSQVELDRLNMSRQQDLRAKGVNSAQDMDTMEATVRGNEARLKSAEGAVANAKLNVDFCNIRSPIDGRVGLRLVDVGNIVSGGSGGGGAILVTIQGMDPIYTDFNVAEPDLPLVRRYLGGDPLKVLTDAEGDDLPPREGELSFIDNSLQPGAGTVKARAVTPNSDRALWPSQFVKVRLILETLKNVNLVPSSAVQIGQNGPYVFVVKQDSTLDLRQVKPGQVHDDLTVVTEGLKTGERVVVSGQLQLAPGAKVAVQPAEPAAGAKPSSKDVK